MSMHSRGMTWAAHQRNSYLYTGQDVGNRKEKESSVKASENSSHAADNSHALDPARVAYRVKQQWIHVLFRNLRGRLMRA